MPKPPRHRGTSARSSRTNTSRHHRRQTLAAERVFEAIVRDLSSDGRGIVEAPDGQVVFVSGVWVGERVRVKQLSASGKIAQGRLVSITEASPERREPPCAFHGVESGSCGGCPWQFVSYEAQFAVKLERVRRLLKKLSIDPAVSALPAPREWGYRNRAQLKSDGQRLGFVTTGSRDLAPIDDCLVMTDRNREQLLVLHQRLPERDWRPSKGHPWTTLDIDDERPGVQVNQRGTFRQGNSEQNEAMLAWLASRIPVGAAPVLELFAGSGNLTAVIARRAQRVLAVEVVASALAEIDAASWPGVVTRQCDLFDAGDVTSLATFAQTSEILVLDPPREGFPELSQLLTGLPILNTVLYIACDTATWARDARPLIAAGFELVDIAVMDLFPQTPHIEILSHWRRA